MKTFPILRLLPLFLFFLAACSDKKDTLDHETVDQYVTAVPGKYRIYRVDSTVFVAGGTVQEIHSYQQKEVVDAAVTDALGRPSMRIYRYTRDLAGTQPWRSIGTYLLTATPQTVETTEDNLRVVRLASPVTKGASWSGNRFLAFSPYEALFGYDYISDDYLGDWNFTYTQTGETVPMNGKSFNNVITVSQINDISVPDTFRLTSNAVTIGSATTYALVEGNATDTVQLTVTAPKANQLLTVWNKASQPLKLNNILTPVGFARIYQYTNGKWGHGFGKDSLLSDPIFAYKNFGLEKYAKGVGLIFQDLLLWEFQPNPGRTPFFLGFGIRRSLIEHN